MSVKLGYLHNSFIHIEATECQDMEQVTKVFYGTFMP